MTTHEGEVSGIEVEIFSLEHRDQPEESMPTAVFVSAQDPLSLADANYLATSIRKAVTLARQTHRPYWLKRACPSWCIALGPQRSWLLGGCSSDEHPPRPGRSVWVWARPVGDDEVGAAVGRVREQGLRVCDGRDDVVASAFEDSHQPFAEQGRVTRVTLIGPGGGESRRPGPVLAGERAEPAVSGRWGIGVDVGALLVRADSEAAQVRGQMGPQREGDRRQSRPVRVVDRPGLPHPAVGRFSPRSTHRLDGSIHKHTSFPSGRGGRSTSRSIGHLPPAG
ncbi:hypothetical protein PCA76_31810 [Micromonospora sp. LH3U1]|nr:hypothetical protein [Micromonospora sp. LH3U1]WCN81393.1 hypothetical protein PCA76_31810 [Micromonospora sp. LH3U1]